MSDQELRSKEALFAKIISDKNEWVVEFNNGWWIKCGGTPEDLERAQNVREALHVAYRQGRRSAFRDFRELIGAAEEER